MPGCCWEGLAPKGLHFPERFACRWGYVTSFHQWVGESDVSVTSGPRCDLKTGVSFALSLSSLEAEKYEAWRASESGDRRSLGPESLSGSVRGNGSHWRVCSEARCVGKRQLNPIVT